MWVPPLTIGSCPRQIYLFWRKLLCISIFLIFFLQLSCCKRFLHKLWKTTKILPEIPLFETLHCDVYKKGQFRLILFSLLIDYNLVYYYNWPGNPEVLFFLFIPPLCIHHGLCSPYPLEQRVSCLQEHTKQRQRSLCYAFVTCSFSTLKKILSF